MKGIMNKLTFIRQAVLNLDNTSETVNKLISLKEDEEFLPVYKVPISTLAIAALDILEVEKYTGDNSDVQLWKDNLRFTYST